MNLITEKGNESRFLKEIPDVYTVKTRISFMSVVEKVILCRKCFSPLEKMWIACPYCGERILQSVSNLNQYFITRLLTVRLLYLNKPGEAGRPPHESHVKKIKE